MSKQTQAAKAKRLRDLHVAEPLLLLPNIWNPIGARMLQSKGFPAVATASAAIGPSLGYQDGEKIKRSTLIYMLDRIARSVDVPVTADYEAGYAATLAELEASIRDVIDAGIVGINFEDSKPDGSGRWTKSEMAERIATVRQTAESVGVPLVINARPDSFMWGIENALEDVIERAAAYIEAGADCIYPIGTRDEAMVKQLRAGIDAPINILGNFSAETLNNLHTLGVNRVSLGPFVFRSTMQKFGAVIDHLSDLATGEALPDTVRGSIDLSPYLHTTSEA